MEKTDFPSSVLDVRILGRREPTKEEHQAIRQAWKRDPTSMDWEDGEVRVALALVGGRDTLCVYQHRTIVQRYSNRYAIDADFIALDAMTDVISAGHGLVIRGSGYGFVRHFHKIGAYEPESQQILDMSDPTAGHQDAEATLIREYAIPADLCEPSLLSVLEAYLGNRDGERPDDGSGATESPATDADADITRQRLSRDAEAERKAMRWHSERHASDWMHRFCDWVMRYPLSDAYLVTCWIVLEICGLVLGWDPILLLMFTEIVFVLLCAKKYMERRSSVLEWRENRILSHGDAGLVREGTDWYLCVADHKGGGAVISAMTAYHVVRLTDAGLDVSYEPGSMLVSFSGAGNRVCVWEGRSLRRDAFSEFVPSRDLVACQPADGYVIADCFVPSIRTVMRMAGAKGA